jgi:hypothetical protein
LAATRWLQWSAFAKYVTHYTQHAITQSRNTRNHHARTHAPHALHKHATRKHTPPTHHTHSPILELYNKGYDLGGTGQKQKYVFLLNIIYNYIGDDDDITFNHHHHFTILPYILFKINKINIEKNKGGDDIKKKIPHSRPPSLKIN